MYLKKFLIPLSTWTIDLAYLLQRFEINFDYYTVTLGIDPLLSNEKFYQTAIRKVGTTGMIPPPE